MTARVHGRAHLAAVLTYLLLMAVLGVGIVAAAARGGLQP